MDVTEMVDSAKPPGPLLLAETSRSAATFAPLGAPAAPHDSTVTTPGHGAQRTHAVMVKAAFPVGSGSCGAVADTKVPPARASAPLEAPRASAAKARAVLQEKLSALPEVSIATGSAHVHSGATLASATE